MIQYIDKSAVMAEIERKISLFQEEKKVEKWSVGASQINVISLGARIAALEEFFSFIKNIEVKEVDSVDLDKGIEKELGTRWYGEYLDAAKFKESAEYFFELGRKAQKGE